MSNTNRKRYEVWRSWWNTPEFESDILFDAVQWLRDKRHSDLLSVHYLHLEEGYRCVSLPSEFISRHAHIVADEMVKKAVESGDHKGVAKDIINLVYGR